MDKPQSSAQDADAQRARTLLEINNAVISSLTREALFHAIAGALRHIMPFDRTAIFLHDPDKDVLRLFILESSLPTSYFTVGMEMPQEESHVGWAFQQQRYRVCRDLSSERRYPMEERAFQDGVRSYVMVRSSPGAGASVSWPSPARPLASIPTPTRPFSWTRRTRLAWPSRT